MKLIEVQRNAPEVLQTHVFVSKNRKTLTYHNTIIDGNFNSEDSDITSLVGSPIKVTGYFNCDNTMITSLKGCPREVGGDFLCGWTQLKNLKNIHKYVQRIGGKLVIPSGIESHMLGILKISGGPRFVEMVGINPTLFAAIDIINEYLYNIPNPMQRDIHKCQEELILAGGGRFAQL